MSICLAKKNNLQQFLPSAPPGPSFCREFYPGKNAMVSMFPWNNGGSSTISMKFVDICSMKFMTYWFSHILSNHDWDYHDFMLNISHGFTDRFLTSPTTGCFGLSVVVSIPRPEPIPSSGPFRAHRIRIRGTGATAGWADGNRQLGLANPKWPLTILTVQFSQLFKIRIQIFYDFYDILRWRIVGNIPDSIISGWRSENANLALDH